MLNTYENVDKSGGKRNEWQMSIEIYNLQIYLIGTGIEMISSWNDQYGHIREQNVYNLFKRFTPVD